VQPAHQAEMLGLFAEVVVAKAAADVGGVLVVCGWPIEVARQAGGISDIELARKVRDRRGRVSATASAWSTSRASGSRRLRACWPGESDMPTGVWPMRLPSMSTSAPSVRPRSNHHFPSRCSNRTFSSTRMALRSSWMGVPDQAVQRTSPALRRSCFCRRIWLDSGWREPAGCCVAEHSDEPSGRRWLGRRRSSPRG
jgi:hypothetical protein